MFYYLDPGLFKRPSIRDALRRKTPKRPSVDFRREAREVAASQYTEKTVLSNQQKYFVSI